MDSGTRGDQTLGMPGETLGTERAAVCVHGHSAHAKSGIELFSPGRSCQLVEFRRGYCQDFELQKCLSRHATVGGCEMFWTLLQVDPSCGRRRA